MVFPYCLFYFWFLAISRTKNRLVHFLKRYKNSVSNYLSGILTKAFFKICQSLAQNLTNHFSTIY